MSLKKFEIQEMIAKGGMAEVYRAKTVGLQGFEKEVCVKKILPHLTEDESFVNMFINEAKLAATLSYANIVSVHDLCVSAGGEYFIVMEYVHGKDLSDLIRAAQLAGRQIPPDIAVYICREVCKGLHYAHAKTDATGAGLNIIHRDISPHNVLVSFMGEVKITDFGIAKASSIVNKTAVGILKGKYGYMSPEQARGQPLDHRSDIFNTGIVLYELLVGERCFAGSSDFSTLNLMRNATVTPPSKINTGISAELEAIVLKSLSADRNDRYADALALESALARLAESRTKSAQAGDLSGFMQQLFSASEENRPSGTTGVLSLSSVVGRAPSAGHPEHLGNKAAPRRSTERAPELADQPISEKHAPPPHAPANGIERQKRRADKMEEPEAAPEASAKTSTLGQKPAEDPQAAKGKDPPAPAKKAKDEPKPNVAGDAPPAPKPERKPARLKPGPEKGSEGAAEAKKEKKGKAPSDIPKKPVGRRDLRPGLTAIQILSRPQRRRTLLRAAGLVVLAGLAGAVAGYLRSGGVSRQRSFREMELSSRDPTAARKPAVTVLIASEPPGATVLFDRIELSDRTPLAVERDRDGKDHTIELALEGHESTKATLRYDTGPVSRVFADLAGDEGTLRVTSKPSDQPVRIDGKPAGNTPLSKGVASGKHQLEIGDDSREILKSTVDVEPKKTTKVFKNVPPKGALASLRISSEPRAQIFLDDQPTGRWTNDGTLSLEPGVSHRVSLMVDDGDDKHEIIVKLKRGEKKELFLDLTGSS